jgi:hypothetical protein
MSGGSLNILTENVLTSFADLVQVNKRRIYKIWIIAPWIGYKGIGTDALSKIMDSLDGTRATLTVITRPPEFVWHYRAVEYLKQHPHREIFHCQSLHTKLYIVECDGFRAAIFGSPNMTSAADTDNRELAVEFRTTRQSTEDPTAAIMRQLITYASSLRTQDDVLPID